MATSFKAHLLRVVPTTFPLLYQPFRTRFIPDPGTLEQRLFRAVTAPVLPPVQLTATEKRIRHEEQRRLQKENNPYVHFLRRKAAEEFYALADDRMLLVLFALFYRPREFMPIRNELFQNGLIFRGFPTSILRDVAVGTRWEMFSKHFLSNSENLYLFGDPDPKLCDTALNIVKKAPFLLVLGGVIQHRILTADQLREFANYARTGGLDGTRSQLLGVLNQVGGQTLVDNLTSHQTSLFMTLKHHSKSSSTPS